MTLFHLVVLLFKTVACSKHCYFEAVECSTVLLAFFSKTSCDPTTLGGLSTVLALQGLH